ncbi:NAD(P)H-quinone oxidoreductase [Actinotalea sp. K2]|uniref:NAD(P)H-quinone oxidoreductase n=1 Tax=Actinotalea sp. K2 TaxID=2939438 RepID=UPI002016CA0D|nr:NAD(P)H-quinone oxidoreductase [Actinotalea sp. K2]MCL3863232.1 NAD(P)H-quinone oxidoreductase [Actinotalea sp. K2]
MRVVKVSRPGGPESLVVGSVPLPAPGHGEALVEVAAAGVNNADLLQRAGLYPPPPGAPDWPGLEISGRIVALGDPAPESSDAGPAPLDQAGRWVVGDEVCALLAGGGYAEHVVVPLGQLLPVPAGIGLVEAAALPEAACTVWSTLVGAAGLHGGEWLLVHGGSGGIGSIAVQVGVALGAHVATTAGGAARGARCAELGAELVVDHRSQDFVELVRAATGGAGVDVVLDVVGGAYLRRNLDALAVGGRLAVIGMQQGRRAELDLGSLLSKRLTVLGTTLRSRPAHEKTAIVAAVREHVWPMVQARRVLPVVHEVLPLAEAARAHELLASGEVFGKLLLVP